MKYKILLRFFFLFILTRYIYAHEICRKKSIKPLIRAVMLGQESYVKTLVKQGVHVNIYDEEGHSPLYYAVKKNNEKIVRFLLESDIGQYKIPQSEKSRCLHLAIEEGLTPLVKFFALYWVDLEGKNLQGDTALIAAVRHRNKEAVETLLLAYASVDAVDRKNNTALHIAARNGDINGVKLLLEFASDITVKNHKGKTAYDQAKKKRKHKVMEMIKIKDK